MGVAVVVVDRQLRVQVWNDQAEDLWGLRPEEVEGEHLLGLDIGLPVDRLRAPLRGCLSGDGEADSPLVLEATNRRGRAVRCEIRCMPLAATDGEGPDGVVVLMEAIPV